MNRTTVLSLLLGAAALSSLPVAAGAQSRSMIPPETLEITLQRQDTMFTRLDLNHDNAITQAELEAAAAQMRARMGGAGPGQGGEGGPAPGAGAGAGAGAGGGQRGGFMQRLMQESDADGDGQITRAEMRASATKRFTEMDKNGDGVLSADERPQGRGPGGGQGRGQGGGQGAGQPVQIPMGEGF